MSDPRTENEAAETEIIVAACEIVIGMRQTNSSTPRVHFEKYLRHKLRRAFLLARAKECKDIGGTYARVRALEAAANDEEFLIAKQNLEDVT